MRKKELKYTFLKSELTSEIMLIVCANQSWLDKEIDFLIESDEIEIKVNDEIYSSGKLPKILKNWLKNHYTHVYFANEDGAIISEAIIGEI